MNKVDPLRQIIPVPQGLYRKCLVTPGLQPQLWDSLKATAAGSQT